MSFSKKMSMVIRNESDGEGKVLTFEEVKDEPGSSKNLHIFGIAPALSHGESHHGGGGDTNKHGENSL